MSKIVHIITQPAKRARTQQERRTNKAVGRCLGVRADNFDNLFFLQVFQVAEGKTKGLLQAPCSLGKNTFVTGPLQHEVLVMQKKKLKNHIQNAKIHQVYIKYQTNALFFFAVSKSVTYILIVNYCTKSFTNISNVSRVIDPLLNN